MSTGLIILTASPLNALGDFSIPEGWLLCDGRTYDKNEYLNLYRHLLKNGPNSSFDSNSNPLLYGGDSNTFKVPDLTDKFLRGYRDGQSDLQPGKETKEQVNIDGVTSAVNSSISFGSNTLHYQVTGLASSEGLHSHTYAHESPKLLDTKLGDNNDHGFFHRRSNIGQDHAGISKTTHILLQGIQDINYCGFYDISDDPPGYDRSWSHYSMWSIAQGNYNLTVPTQADRQRQFSIMRMDNNSGKVFGSRRWPHSYIDDHPNAIELTNTNIRHIHKYSINISESGGHQHTLSEPVNETHSHTHTVSSFSDSVQSSIDGQELRPANTRMVYLIYAK